MLCTEELSKGFQRGSHASTYGGNPLATSAGLAVLSIIDSEGLLARATAIGEQIRGMGNDFTTRHGVVVEARGLGAMNGIVLDCEAAEAAKVVVAARERGLFFNTAGGNVLRLVPPLIVSDEEVARAMQIIDESLTAVFG
ncbi:MAG: 4-aminobutyrate aminotransferase-like enzyme [Bradymonadia bacterium]|jgi:4-aminobutyrate aminotransferase-like enzyme